MNTKLTLSINNEIIEQAKVYAKSKDISLSKLIEDFLTLKLQSEQQKIDELGIELEPWLKNISGMVKSDNDHMSYKELRDLYRTTEDK